MIPEEFLRIPEDYSGLMIPEELLRIPDEFLRIPEDSSGFLKKIPEDS